MKKEEQNRSLPDIVKLDSIVNEVKQSEEWEAVHMNILEIGKEIKLVELVCRKLQKNKSAKQIAEELEEEETLIEEICNVAIDLGPDYDAGKVYQCWKKVK